MRTGHVFDIGDFFFTFSRQFVFGHMFLFVLDACIHASCQFVFGLSETGYSTSSTPSLPKP